MRLVLSSLCLLFLAGSACSCEKPAAANPDPVIEDVTPAEDNNSQKEELIHYTIPTLQDGTIKEIPGFESSPFHVLNITIGEGNYTVKELLVRSAKGELIAGDVTYNPETREQVATDSEIRIVLPSVIDASKGDVVIHVMVAPVLLTAGYTLGATDASGNYTEEFHGWRMPLAPGGTTTGGNVASRYHTQLAFVAGSSLYLVDADLASGKTYKDGLIWKWNSSQHKAELGTANTNNMDECKIIDGGNAYLVTSSYNWAAIVDARTGDVKFFSDKSTMAHSAELLPGNRLVVACSSGGDCLQVFDRDRSNEVLYSCQLYFAHGAVWDPESERLYASGYDKVNVYGLENWDGASPSLKLLKSIPTPRTHVHDLQKLESGTLTVSGSWAFYWDIETEEFSEIPFFSNRINLKSVNCNPETGEAWYTQATEEWWTHEIRHIPSFREESAENCDASISVNLPCYKVRVRRW